MAVALHILTGKLKGMEVLLPQAGDFLLGLSEGGEVMFDAPDAPVQHAVISVSGNDISLADLCSGGTTTVNRKKVGAESLALHEGDRLRIGKALLMLVKVNRFSPVLKQARARSTDATAEMKEAGFNGNSTPGSTLAKLDQPAKPTVALAGSLSQMNLLEVLQFLGIAGRDGDLVVSAPDENATIYIRNGNVAHVAFQKHPPPNSRRALFRVLRWHAGSFLFQPPATLPVEPTLHDSMGMLLLEAAQERDQWDAVAANLPPLDARLEVTRLRSGNLNKMAPAELLLLGLVRMHGTVRKVLDHHPESDVSAASSLIQMLENKILQVA